MARREQRNDKGDSKSRIRRARIGWVTIREGNDKERNYWESNYRVSG